MERFCLAQNAPRDVLAVAPGPDEDGLCQVEVDGLRLSLVDGRISQICAEGSLFFDGEDLIGRSVNEVATLLMSGEVADETYLHDDGSVLNIISGRRRDFEVSVWGNDGRVTMICVEDYTWIEN